MDVTNYGQVNCSINNKIRKPNTFNVNIDRSLGPTDSCCVEPNRKYVCR